jgi:hypothetical protein
MTRGMERLYVSSVVFDNKFDRMMKMPSRFLFEGGLINKDDYSELVQEARENYMG